MDGGLIVRSGERGCDDCDPASGAFVQVGLFLLGNFGDKIVDSEANALDSGTPFLGGETAAEELVTGIDLQGTKRWVPPTWTEIPSALPRMMTRTVSAKTTGMSSRTM
jgi:hypothetical protein